MNMAHCSFLSAGLVAPTELARDQPFVFQAGWTIAHSVWQFTLIALLFAVCMRVLRRQAAWQRYVIACLFFAAFPCVLVATYLQQSPSRQFVSSRITSARDTELVSDETASRTALAANGHRQSPATGPVSGAVEYVRRDASFRRGCEALFPWIVGLWIVGTLACSLRLLAGCFNLLRLKSARQLAVPDWIEGIVRELTARLGIHREIRVVESGLVEIPAIVGWWAPVILLPATVIAGLNAAELRMILAHELAHARRHDFVVNFVQLLVETVCFYHPAVWWISRCIRVERENCCDDLTIDICADRATYVRALVAVQALQTQQVPTSLVSAGGGSLVCRIRRIAHMHNTRSTTASMLAPRLATVLALLLVILTVAFQQLGASQPDQPPLPVKPVASTETDPPADSKSPDATAQPNAPLEMFIVASSEASQADNAPQPVIDQKLYKELSDRLKQQGPEAASTDEYRWFPVHEVNGEQIDGTVVYQDQQYLLLALAADKSLRWDGSWWLTEVSLTQQPKPVEVDALKLALEKLAGTAPEPRNQTGPPSISATITDKGGERVLRLTSTNNGRKLAIVVDGEVLIAPSIRAEVSSRFMITGKFDEKTAKAIEKSLRRGLKPADASGASSPDSNR